MTPTIIGNLAMSRCACSGSIVVLYPNERNIERAVREHQATSLHREWWQRGGLEQRPVRVAA